MRSLARLLLVLLLVSICVALALADDAPPHHTTVTLPSRPRGAFSVLGGVDIDAFCDGAHRVYVSRSHSGVDVALEVVPFGCALAPCAPVASSAFVRQPCRNRVGAVIPCVEAAR